MTFSALICWRKILLASELMEEALKVPSWQIAPPVYRETDGEDIPLSLLGGVDWIIREHREDEHNKSHTWQTVEKN